LLAMKRYMNDHAAGWAITPAKGALTASIRSERLPHLLNRIARDTL
jgi:hypothetical protein